MLTDKEILTQIKSAVQEVIPDAKVYLFGSRARGDWNEESDWDILVLTKEKQPMKTRWRIHDVVLPLEIETSSLFQFIVATEEEWKDAPRYYALQLGIGNDLVSL